MSHQPRRRYESDPHPMADFADHAATYAKSVQTAYLNAGRIPCVDVLFEGENSSPSVIHYMHQHDLVVFAVYSHAGHPGIRVVQSKHRKKD